MQTFRDTAGRVWTVALNVALVKRVRLLLGVDLYGLIDDRLQPLATLLGDPVQLVDVLFVLVQDQAQAQGVSDEAFGMALGGDALEQAATAFVEALTSFFPNAQLRQALTRALAAGREVQRRLLDQAEAELAALDPATVVQQLQQSGWSMNSPAASGSTPAPSRSTNSS